MGWEEALEIAVARHRCLRWRWLCSEANPDAGQRDAYRRHMIELAAPSYPAMAVQARNLARAFRDWAMDGFRRVGDDELTRRLAICATCPEWEPIEGRCRQCGCYGAWKARLASEHCPLDPPKW